MAFSWNLGSDPIRTGPHPRDHTDQTATGRLLRGGRHPDGAGALAAITHPVFVASGDSDPMIPPRYSHLIAGLLPHATVKIYPDAAHRFLWQYHSEFAADVTEFLS
jgi:pimeloyl-ACP methyl ester carboxylesterase